MGTEALTKSGDIITTQRLHAYCPDLADWPSSWRFEQRDIAPGQQLVELLTAFLLHLLDANLSKKTLHKHRDNLWLLGGEIIRHLQQTPKLRKQPMRTVVLGLIGDEGGPLIHHGVCESDQRAFDSTCRKLYRFLDPPR